MSMQKSGTALLPLYLNMFHAFTAAPQTDAEKFK